METCGAVCAVHGQQYVLFSECLAESFFQWSNIQMELDIVKLLQYFWFCDQLLVL